MNNGIKLQEGPFGVPDPFVAGLGVSKPKIGMTHPIELSERNVSHRTTTSLISNLFGITGDIIPAKNTLFLVPKVFAGC